MDSNFINHTFISFGPISKLYIFFFLTSSLRMSFGFSVGDFLAVGKLATDIISSLKDSGGSRTEYQHLLRELECLQAALVHLDRLSETRNTHGVATIKYTALSCRRPLEEFLTKIRKYDGSLGIQSKPNPIKGVVDKVKFPLAHKDEVQALQAYLNVHINTINILLTEHGLEKMQLMEETAEANHLKVGKLFEYTNNLVRCVQTSVNSQSHAILGSTTVLEKLYEILTGDAVRKIYASIQQIHAIVLQIRTSITSTPDIRWTFFQDPLIVEDALGRKFPLPSEYDYLLLDAIIKHKFRDGPGATQVAAGDYEIMYTRNRRQILSNNSQLKPGSSLTMAIIISDNKLVLAFKEGCPMPYCQSKDTIIVPDGGRRW
ncbi:hypothetical protein F4805DRAFT_419707 [Annulohypoxylon moriforme]|nr:hypothetical protein F4805DRAFT_419707 [Annulohypoxylon moriforme]